MERKLTAILAADVVGYSRLMEADEAGTLSALKSHRKDLIDPEIAERNLQIVGEHNLSGEEGRGRLMLCAGPRRTSLARKLAG